jgi:uncharacterized membrane protein YdjX (TVP38/TMEM64 family)
MKNKERAMSNTAILHDDAIGEAPPKRRKGWVKLAVLAAILVGLIVAFKFLPIQGWLKSFVAWADGLGWWGRVVLGAAWIPVCVLLVPGSLLTLGTGFTYGLWEGTIIVSLGSTIGSAVAFLVGRTAARDWIGARLEGNARFASIDHAIGREGWKIVFLTRLSPIFPFNLLNYGLGLTKVPFWHYVLASWIGMLPGTFMYVYFASVAKELTASVDTGVAGKVALGIGLAVTIVITIFVTRIAKRALDRAVADGASAPAAGEEEA